MTTNIVVLVLLAALGTASAATTRIYPAPAAASDCYKQSQRFQVAVDGQQVFVYDFDPADTLAIPPKSLDPQPQAWDPAVFAAFDFEGTVTVSVTVLGEAVHSATVRPRSLGIMPSVSGNTVRFTLSHSCNLGLEINDNANQPLFIFANPMHPVPDKNDPNVLFIKGGAVYDSFKWPAVAGKTVYIEGGAVVRCIKGIDGKIGGTKILGSGIVTGETPDKNQHIFGWAEGDNVYMNGPIFISTHHGGKWGVCPFRFTNSRITNIKAFGLYRDAFDLLSSSDIIIENCFLWSRDDACVIKASQWAEFTPVRNVTVRNSVIWNHGLAVGFETRAPYIENITFQNCDIVRYCSNTGNPINPAGSPGIRNPVLMIMVSDQAKVSNIRYDNIRVEDPWTDVFFQWMIEKNYASTLSEPGGINGVYVKNLKVIDTDSRLKDIYRSEIKGYDSSNQVRNIFIEGLVWEGVEKRTIEEANLKISRNVGNVVVAPLASRSAPPQAPAELVAHNPGAFIIQLAWKDNADNEDGFIVQRREPGKGFTEIVRTVANFSEWKDRDLSEGTSYTYRVAAYNDAGVSAYTAEVALQPRGQVPFHGKPGRVPGVIQFEDFDLGGEKFAWHDTTSGNGLGATSGGAYRTDVDVDIGVAGKGYKVGWVSKGEWMEYTLDIVQSAQYTVTVTYATLTNPVRMVLATDNKKISEEFILPGTGGWVTFSRFDSHPFHLDSGKAILRVTLDGSVNLDSMEFRVSGPATDTK